MKILTDYVTNSLSISFVIVYGDTEDDDAWLHNHIPKKYREEIFHTEAD